MASPLSLPFSIPLPFIFQEAKESIDEEDPRPTSSNGACTSGWPCFFSVCHRTWLSLDSIKGADDRVLSLHANGLDCLWMVKKVRMTMFCLYMPSNFIVFGQQKGCEWPCFVSVSHRTLLSLDGDKGVDDHVLSLRVIRLDCLWIAKMMRMTMFCLCVPSDFIVFGYQKGFL